jgi:ATP-dependent RNA helicase DeaD
LVSTLRDIEAGEAIASFSELRLSPVTLQSLGRMGIEIPTPIQAQTLPALLDGRDVIGQARTGSGKTLAFGIPAIEIIDARQRAVQVLVLTPTRELAVQVAGVLEELGAPKGVSVGLIFGGRAFGPQRDLLRRGVNIVVGTPGRVLDLLNQGGLWLDKVRLLVLDEADEMLDRGFAPDVERIMARTNSSRQTALFSATVPDWVRQTASKHLDHPIAVAVDPNPEDAAPIEHFAYDVTNGDKLGALKELLDHRGDGSIIVFGRTKHGVKKLARQLEGAGYPVAALQGNLSQNARDRVMEDFRSGAVPVLLATNVAARGLDVTHVGQVINVELPESHELLTHRIGRTGRMGRRGQAITLLGPEDGPKWRQLERGLGRRIPRAPWRGAQAAITGESSISEATPPVVNAAPLPPRPAQPRPAPQPRRATIAPDRLAAPVAAPVAPPVRSLRPVAPAPRRAPDAMRPAMPGNSVTRDRDRERERERVEDIRVDAVIADPRPLLASYGRDPRRPSWVGGDVTVTPADETLGVPRRRRHRVDCANCGQPAEVPFRPDPTRAVYCDTCFRERGRPARSTAGMLAQV